ncbi:hypothetical protein GGS24DRAFT_460920 [Hypoxylon argillaceum]|nr:hypothetical protein GGS24DRAFT_460920 [Hypoxylon argillaceum]
MRFVILTESELVKMHRPGVGIIRMILNIAGAINSSIGTDTGAHAKEELKREPGKPSPFGFEIDDKDGTGYKNIQLRPILRSTRNRRRLRIKRHTLYGQLVESTAEIKRDWPANIHIF